MDYSVFFKRIKILHYIYIYIYICLCVYIKKKSFLDQDQPLIYVASIFCRDGGKFIVSFLLYEVLFSS